jgi:two-component system cell cycle response regulator
MRVLVARVLSPEGFDVEHAEGGLQCLARARQDPLPDVIVLDLSMPVLDGGEVLRLLRSDAATASIPVVILSALGFQRRNDPGLDAADAVIDKPFGVTELVDAVRDAVA